MSAPIKTDSSSSRRLASISFFPLTTSSIRATKLAFVELTADFSLLRSPSLFSDVPNRVCIQFLFSQEWSPPTGHAEQRQGRLTPYDTTEPSRPLAIDRGSNGLQPLQRPVRPWLIACGGTGSE